MSELGLTLARLGFLALLWGFVIITVLVLRRDLRQPSDAKPGMRSTRTRSAARARAPRKARAPKPVCCGTMRSPNPVQRRAGTLPAPSGPV